MSENPPLPQCARSFALFPDPGRGERWGQPARTVLAARLDCPSSEHLAQLAA